MDSDPDKQDVTSSAKQSTCQLHSLETSRSFLAIRASRGRHAVAALSRFVPSQLKPPPPRRPRSAAGLRYLSPGELDSSSCASRGACRGNNAQFLPTHGHRCPWPYILR